MKCVQVSVLYKYRNTEVNGEADIQIRGRVDTTDSHWSPSHPRNESRACSK